MKLIITVLAILISGIASAQWEVSVCDGEIVENDNRYEVLRGLQTQIEGFTNTRGINFVCVDNVRVSNGLPYFNRYFNWYLDSSSRSITGNQYTGEENTIYTYSWSNNRTVIRAYPSNYSDGRTFFLDNGVSRRRISHERERPKAGKFEVRTNANGSSANIRLFDDAQAAWNYANGR